MQDRCHFWVQNLEQADHTSISPWEAVVLTAAGPSSFGPNADEFMRDTFLFGLNESFSRFREDIFYRDGQSKPEDPPFTLAFVVSQAMSFEPAQRTNKLLAHSSIADRSTMPRQQPEIFNAPAEDQSANLVSSVAAKRHILVENVQPKEKHATDVTNWATF